MSGRRIIGYSVWLLLACCLYFFENNTGTRIVLICAALLPFLPQARRFLFSPDEGNVPETRPATVQAFSFREEEEPGDVRSYQPGDPINRVHWKLSAKRNELLVRQAAHTMEPEAAEAEARTSNVGNDRGSKRKKQLAVFLAVLLLSLLFLLFIPAVSRSAQALCNRLFDASEAVNAYVYDRFPVPEEQSVAWALALLVFLLTGWMGILLLSGSRLLALFTMAGIALFQVYFGLAFPGWLNVLLFALFAFWMARRPWKRQEIWCFLAVLLIVSMGVLLLFPGVDAATEAASERARDRLSLLAQQVTGTARETPAEINETRHTHSLSFTAGEQEAQADKEYFLKTLKEAQISMPHWVDYLKIALLLLLAILLIIAPFLPFLWLNARRKKAMEGRKAFEAENVNDAVCAIFQQVIAWLEVMKLDAGNLPYREWARQMPESVSPDYAQRFASCAALFEEAAYSSHPLTEAQRQQALDLLEQTEKAFWAKADWKQRLYLRYIACLWIGKE